MIYSFIHIIHVATDVHIDAYQCDKTEHSIESSDFVLAKCALIYYYIA